MKVGDLIIDHDLGQHGVITEAKAYRHYQDTENEVLAFEYIVFYEDGSFDMAYENALEVISASR